MKLFSIKKDKPKCFSYFDLHLKRKKEIINASNKLLDKRNDFEFPTVTIPSFVFKFLFQNPILLFSICFISN